jgi:hypothetical protein
MSGKKGLPDKTNNQRKVNTMSTLTEKLSIKYGERKDLESHLELAVLMYCDYRNDFLTVERFAEFYGITKTHARAIIACGRKILNKQRKV